MQKRRGQKIETEEEKDVTRNLKSLDQESVKELCQRRLNTKLEERHCFDIEKCYTHIE